MKRELQTLLKKRAIEMSREIEEVNASSVMMEIIHFSLAKEEYAVASSYVKEVYQLKDYTPLPGVPGYILGIINLRGQVLPIMDLKKLFLLPDKGIGELNKVIILKDGSMEFAILSDHVRGAKMIDAKSILSVPDSHSSIKGDYIKGATKDNIILLDAKKILNDKKLVVNNT